MRQIVPSLDIAKELDASLSLDRARGIALDLSEDRYLSAQDLAHNLDRAHKLAYSLDRALHNTNSLDYALALDRQIDSLFADARGSHGYLGDFAGRVLARATYGALRDTFNGFAEMLVNASAIPNDGRWIVSLDELETNVRDCETEIVGSLGSWATTVATRIKEIALPVVTGQRPLTADNATAIRLGALCLAGETGSASARDLFHQIAAGITLLERRAGGEAPVTETIVLAME